MDRQDVINTLEELMEQMKVEGVEDATENTFLQAIYTMESVIATLKENEE